MIKNFFIIECKNEIDKEDYFLKDYHDVFYYDGKELKLGLTVSFTKDISSVKKLFNSYKEAADFEFKAFYTPSLLKLQAEDFSIIRIRKFELEDEDLLIDKTDEEIIKKCLPIKDLTEEQADKVCDYMFETYGIYKGSICTTPMKEICKHCPLAIRTESGDFTCMNGKLNREIIDKDLLKILRR